jgi:ubiquinone/menaquinone biosynthesis C-methylase UbiE
MKMRPIEKRFVNSARHSNRVAVQAERRLRTLNPQPGARLLDVGCGNGAAAIQAAHTLELDTVGIDVDPDQIRAADAAARGLAGVRFLVADAASLSFPDDSFDLVYTNNTTHHLRDWRRGLTEMARVLKPGGTLTYSDFVAPLGNRLPTRRGLGKLAAELGFTTVRRSGSPLHCTAFYHKPTDGTCQPR